MENQDMVVIDLIPVDEYHQTQNPKSAKPYSCNRCDRKFAVKIGPTGVKDHMKQVHREEINIRQVLVPASKARKRKAETGEINTAKKPSLDNIVSESPADQENSNDHASHNQQYVQ